MRGHGGSRLPGCRTPGPPGAGGNRLRRGRPQEAQERVRFAHRVGEHPRSQDGRRHPPRPDRRLYEIAWPMGVVAALVPSTNPTSTAFFKTLIAVKARNAIIFSPHPSAVRCIFEAVADHGAGGRECRRAPRADRLHAADFPAGHAGTDEPPPHRPDPGDRRFGHGAGRPLHRQTGLRRGSRQRAGLCRPQRGHRKGRALHRRLQGLRLLHHLRHRTGSHRRPPDRPRSWPS